MACVRNSNGEYCNVYKGSVQLCDLQSNCITLQNSGSGVTCTKTGTTNACDTVPSS
jgi:hypothetical protein